jgi:hypothetical protein
MTTEILVINDDDYEIVKRYVHQGLNEIGYGVFYIRASQSPGIDLVEYYCSILNEDLDPLFYGNIHAPEEVSPGLYKLVCRENTALLETKAPISIQHPTPKQILSELKTLTGLDFIYAETAAYMDKLAPYFYSLNNARFALNAMPPLYGLELGIWFQLATGQVYWGEWKDSHFAEKNPVTLDYDMVLSRSAVDNTIRLPLVPGIISGMRILDPDHWGDVPRLIVELDLGDMDFNQPDQMTLKCIEI